MKICLVPYPIIIDSNPDTIDRKQLYPYLPFGLLTLATLLEQHGHKVVIIEPETETGTGQALCNPERFARLIQAGAPDIVGFSTICTSYPLVIKWTEAFHRLSPATPILLGGPQATASDEETLRAFPWIDMILRGEAENSIIPLATCLNSGGNPASVPGLTWRKNNQIIRNPDAPVISDLDTLPLPAYHLYPMEQIIKSYNLRTGRNRQKFPLEAGRGCPFNCTFCSTSSFFKRRYRSKSAGKLIEEMVTLHTRYGIEHFDLVHDLFTCNRAYISEFCRRLREKGFHNKLKWECSSRVDTIDHNILEDMVKAGCQGIFFGIETGSPRMQKLIKKNLPISQIKSAVKKTHSLKMRVTTSFICGFPQENMEDLSATLTMITQMIFMGIDSVQLHLLYPLSGSELSRKFGDTLLLDGQWSNTPFKCLSLEEQKLVTDWPNIFSSFYHYKTPDLDFDMLRALSSIINRYPRFLAAMSRENIDLIEVMKAWPEWLHTHKTPFPEYYYQQSEFIMDFVQFLHEYLNGNALMTPVLNDIINYHRAVERAVLTPPGGAMISERFSSDVVALLRHLTEEEFPLTEDTLQPADYLFWKSNDKVITKRVTPALAELLEISPLQTDL